MQLRMQLKWDAQALVMAAAKTHAQVVNTLVKMAAKTHAQVADIPVMVDVRMQIGKMYF